MTARALSLAVGLVASVAVATPATAEPIGALGAGSELAVVGPGPVQRLDAEAVLYLTHRAGVTARVGRVALDGGAGVATLGVAYRASAARPRLELVVDAALGVAWPTAPAATAGFTTYVWPTRLPVAVTLLLRSYALVDGDAQPIGLSLGIGLAVAR